MEKDKEYEEVELFSSLNEYQINEICAVLTENNIPFIKKTNGPGAYMNLYMGQSIQEKKVFVSKKDYDKSVELISIFINVNTYNEEENQYKKDKVSNTLTIISKIAISMVLIFPILLIILGMVLAIVQ